MANEAPTVIVPFNGMDAYVRDLAKAAVMRPLELRSRTRLGRNRSPYMPFPARVKRRGVQLSPDGAGALYRWDEVELLVLPWARWR